MEEECTTSTAADFGTVSQGTTLLDLPPDLIANIVSRIPHEDIGRLKLACRKLYLTIKISESLKQLLFLLNASRAKQSRPVGRVYKLGDFHQQQRLISRIPIPFRGRLVGAANGLICMCDSRQVSYMYFYVLNPVTKECIKVIFPKEDVVTTYGFGVGGEYKMVTLSRPTDQVGVTCNVYTLGTGSWRTIAAVAPPSTVISDRACGVFFNGYLHWLNSDSGGISIFNVNTEGFSTFPGPPLAPLEKSRKLFAFEEELGICVHTSDKKLAIWVLNNNSWVNKFVVNTAIGFDGGSPYDITPTKIFASGEILMNQSYVFYYDTTDCSTREFDMFGGCVAADSTDAVLFTPNFESLKSLTIEEVTSF